MLVLKSNLKRRKCVKFTSLVILLSCALLWPAKGWSQSPPAKFTTNLFNIEKAANETFRYNATLKSNTNVEQKYDLKADVPAGWRTSFKVRGSNITSILLEGNKTESISIELIPVYNCKPGTYEIPVTASSETDTLSFDLEAVVKGSYEVQLTTPSGRLSGDVVEGKTMQITLKVKNSGSLPLNKLNLTSRTPSKWQASFSPESIESLEPDESVDVSVSLSVPEKTLPGDYISSFTVKNSETKGSADYRVTVETSVLAGWIGVLVILVAIGIIFFLIRKFGRR
ncbi:NEW3 domain-containing protein [Ekhidna sp. MALMAid0563]|uniref:COG1470 family protein n=1 Tax=Ekhidna sp. MALMAid0563 TaxID=3143937 RepID=UPI0032E03208